MENGFALTYILFMTEHEMGLLIKVTLLSLSQVTKVTFLLLTHQNYTVYGVTRQCYTAVKCLRLYPWYLYQVSRAYIHVHLHREVIAICHKNP